MDEKRYDKAFPQQNNLILVVIDGATAERADEAAASLAAALKTDTRHFTHVRRPDAGPFFAHNGLLLLPEKEVQQTMQQLIAAQPFLGGLAADPSLRGLMTTLDTTLLGVEGGQTKLAAIDKPIVAFNATLRKVLAGQNAWFGWSQMLGSTPDTGVAPTRRFIEVKPVLDYNDLMPGVKATDAIREAARDLGLTQKMGVRVRLTGPVPMADEEFATIAENGLLMVALMGGAVLLDAVAGAAFGAHDRGHPPHHVSGPCHDGLHRPSRLWRLQCDFGRLHRIVRRARHRFRHPVLRALPP